MTSPSDAVQAAGAILGAVAKADLTPEEGAQLMERVETFRRTLETHELEGRLADVDEALRGSA